VLEKKSDFVSIKRDLLPFLLRKQYSMTTADMEVFPPEASEVANPRVQHLALDMSSAERSWVSGPDGAGLLHCHAFVVDAAKPSERCQRVNTLVAYSEANRTLAKGYRPDDAARAALASLPARLIGSECVVGPGLTATGEGSSVKKSVVGANCAIGASVKIVNCVLMDNVTIEDGCSLSGVTVCSGAHIEPGCELREGCCVGHDYRLPAQTQAAKDTHFSTKSAGGAAASED
jgi:translation initiation factor eIF-2B subunit gamma